MQNAKTQYTGDIVAGSLLVAESREIARLLLDRCDQDRWRQAIVVDNVLQKRSPVAAKRQARLIKARLSLMTLELWEIIVTDLPTSRPRRFWLQPLNTAGCWLTSWTR